MSSIAGPSPGSKLPRTILPMEVITVSRYTSPMVSSVTTRLELTLERLGLNTIPMDIVPTGISWSTSTSSRVLKQATTLAKPWGGVGGLTNASVLAGWGGFGGNGAFGGLDGGLMEVVWVSWRALLFALGAVVGWGVSPVATTGQDRCTTVSHLAYFVATFGMGGASVVSVAAAGAEELLLSTGTIVIISSIHHSHPNASGGRVATLHYFSQTRTLMVSSPKEA